jgi:RNA polymerase sigma-70 factor (ECF subfamily)
VNDTWTARETDEKSATMESTSASLLVRLKDPAESAAWERFVKLYSPLLFFWARRQGLQDSDASDLVQDVLATLVRKIPDFIYDRGKGFRDWLKTVLLNKWRDRLRKRAPVALQDEMMNQVPDSVDQGFEEAEYRAYIVKQALELMQAEFAPKTWKACWEHVVQGRSAAEVAAELGISEGSVYVAKSRVLARLRVELEGLLED